MKRLVLRQSLDDWADIYDRVYNYLNHDVPFYVNLATASGGPVLELGCGTARISIAMAEAGLDVIGVDISQAMLEKAQLKTNLAGLDHKCQFRQGDMRSITLGRQYPLAVMPFRSFQFMLNPQDQYETLANAKTHLQPGGLLAFDIFAPDLAMLTDEDPKPFHVQSVPQPDTGNTFAVYGQNHWDHALQTNMVKLIIKETNPNKKFLRQLSKEYTVRYSFPDEILTLLESTGFTLEALYGDFNLGPLTEDSDDLVVLARA